MCSKILGLWRLDWTECLVVWKYNSHAWKAEMWEEERNSSPLAKNLLSSTYKQRRIVYSGVQNVFPGRLCLIQRQAFSCSLEKVRDLRRQKKEVDVNPKTKPLKRQFSRCNQSFKVFLLSEVNRVVKKIPTEGIFHLRSPYKENV